MSVIEQARKSFAGGEVAEDLNYRSDLTQHQISAARMRNLVGRVQGGAMRRSGTQFVAVCAKPAKKAHVRPFRFSSTDAQVVEWGDFYARFHQNGAPLFDGAAPREIATTYAEADLPEIRSAQSADVQWLFSGEQTKELRRGPNYAFSLVDAVFRNGPFLDRNIDKNTLIAASGVSGTVTLTASAPLFDALHVGSFWRLDEQDWRSTPRWVGNRTVSSGDQVRVGGSVYAAQNGGETSPNAPLHLEGEQADSFEAGAIVWRYLHSGFGVVKITAATSTTQASASVVSRLPDLLTSAGTWKWSEGAWSDFRGWPRVGALFQNRLFGGNAGRNEHWIWGSAIQGYDDFEDGDLDDQAVRRALVDGEIDPINWFASGVGVLVVGAAGREWVIKPDQGKSTITPGFKAAATTNEGSATLDPIIVGQRVLFFDTTRQRLMSFSYDFTSDSYLPEDLSVRAYHITGAGVVDHAWQKRSRILWAVLDSGQVASFTYQYEERVFAWALHDFGDPVESVTAVPADGNTRDDVYFVVNRRLGGIDQRCVERLKPEFRPDRGDALSDAWFLDSAVEVVDAGAAQITGLGHLEGRLVRIMVDGHAHPDRVVSGGAVPLDFTGDRVLAGLPFKSLLRTLPFDVGDPAVSQIGRRLSLTKIAIAVRDTVGGVVRASWRPEHVDLLDPQGGADIAAPPDLWSGARKYDAPSSTDVGGQIEVEFDSVYPATVLAISPEYEV